MITLHPYASFEKTAKTLDWARLWAQLGNNLVLMRSFAKVYEIRDAETGESGWSHHTVGLFWYGHELALARYSVALATEALKRPLPTATKLESLAKRKNVHSFWVELEQELVVREFPELLPPLIGDADFHSATRAYLKYKEQESETFRLWRIGWFPDHACHRNNLPRRASWTREDYIRLWGFFNPPPLRWYNRWNWAERPDDSRFYLTRDRIPILERETKRKVDHPLSPEAWKSYKRGQRLERNQ